MIAVELASLLGADLGLETVEQIWSEITELAPSHRGMSRAGIDGAAAADGALAPGDGEGVIRFEPRGPVELAANDAYGLRLVMGRKLYDLGTTVQQSSSLAGLVARIRAAGQRLRLRQARRARRPAGAGEVGEGLAHHRDRA